MNSEDLFLEDVMRSRLTPAQFEAWAQRRANAAAAEISNHSEISNPAEISRVVSALSRAGYRVDVEISGKVPWSERW
jgi:hypothetical protein